MANTDFLEGIEFADASEDDIERLKALFTRDIGAGPLGDDLSDAMAPSASIVSMIQDFIRDKNGGCRLGAGIADFFPVTEDETGDIVIRCQHDPYHQWRNGVREK